MKRFFLTFLFVVSSNFSVYAQDFSTPVTPEFWDGEIRFEGEFNVVYIFRWTVVPSNGRLAVCGAGHFRNGAFRGTVRGMASDATFYVNNQPHPIDLNFFTRVSRRSDLDTATAQCVITGVSASGARSVAVAFGSGTYRN